MCGDSDEGLGTIRGEGWTTDSDVGRGVGVGLSVTAKCARNANAEPISRLECGQEACRGRGWRRVLARGMEDFIQNEMLFIGRQCGAQRLLGKYIPTKKNGLVAELYKRLDYRLLNNENGSTLWECPVEEGASMRKTFIEQVDDY